MGFDERTSRRMPVQDAAGQTVGDVMIKRPKTVRSDVLVGVVRRAFEQPSLRTVLLSDGERFVGAIEREGLPVDAAEDQPASRYIEADPVTVTPGMPIAAAVELLERRGEPRLIVLDEDGLTLRGLLCASGNITAFCVR